MDTLAHPLMGIGDWDDAVCVKFVGKTLVASVDGPYTKRLVGKSALVHAATDVVVKGARPLFALDTLIGPKDEIREMVGSLKKQALAMGIPILGGNTLIDDVEPLANITVIGELVVPKPIRDCGAKKGDVIALLGEPIWGEQDERIRIAKKLFGCWFMILENRIRINAAKDVTKGGLISVAYEMQKKSKRKFNIKKELPYPPGRNLDNFILALPLGEYKKIEKIAAENKCGLERIGVVE
jgi:selenophosphate synthetase-related protein